MCMPRRGLAKPTYYAGILPLLRTSPLMRRPAGCERGAEGCVEFRWLWALRKHQAMIEPSPGNRWSSDSGRV